MKQFFLGCLSTNKHNVYEITNRQKILGDLEMNSSHFRPKTRPLNLPAGSANFIFQSQIKGDYRKFQRK